MQRRLFELAGVVVLTMFLVGCADVIQPVAQLISGRDCRPDHLVNGQCVDPQPGGKP